MVRGGGLTGLVITATVDSTALSNEDASTLRAMVDDAAPALADPPPTTNLPDAESFRITIEDGQRTSAVLTDLPPAVRSLVDWVESHPARAESVNPPG